MKYTKGSFITVPNKEGLRGMKPQTQCLFMWLCQYANTSGKCFPSKKKLSEDCGMAQSTVLRCLNELISAGFLIKEVRKDKKTGRNESNLYTVLIGEGVRETRGGPHKDTGGGCQSEPLTQSKDKLNTINSTASQSDAGKGALVNKLIDAFVDVNPSFTRFYRMKNQRGAADRLIKQHGLEKMIQVVKYLPISNRAKYAPTITTPYELEMKLAKLAAFFAKERQSGKGKKINLV